MRPIGHLASTAALGAGVYAATGSAALTAGVALGGVLIDLDHLFDYVTFNRQRDFRPSVFLDYYATNRFQWVVLALHSYELMGALAALNWLYPHPLLGGYLIGAALHLGLDLIFNHSSLGHVADFYSFLYRASRGFSRDRLLRREVIPRAGEAES